MQNLMIAVFDGLASLFFAFALCRILLIPAERLDKFSKYLLAICLSIYFLVSVANVLEYAGITAHLDRFEDYFEILFLPCFMFFLFAYDVRLEINSRHRTEEALSASEKLYRTLVDNIDLGVTLIGKDHRIRMTNATQGRLFHRDPATFVGKFCYHEFEGREGICDHCPGVRAMARGTVQEELTQGVRADGSRFDVQIRAFPLLDAAGETDGFVELVEDVTSRLQTEQALRENEAKFRALFDLAPMAVALTDLQGGRLVDVNMEFCRITGVRCPDVLGRSAVELGFYSERDRQDLVVALQEKGEVSGLEKTFMVQGQPRHALMFSRIVELRDNRFVLTVFNDITEIKKMEEDLQRIARIESVGILAGGIAHDFNNILTGVLGNISLAKMYCQPDDKVFAKLRETEYAALRARDLTQQLLTFSRGGEPVRRSASVAALVREASDFVLSGSMVRAEYDLPDDLWPADIDSGQISQVVQNLAFNAVQAMAEGGTITVSAENVIVGDHEASPLAAGRYVRLSYADDGPGIAAEHLPHIFDPYFTTKKSGNGLGLAICHTIIKRHRGLLTVESSVGRGTTFFIHLPAAAEAPQSVGTAADLLYGSGRVLVVDDEEIILSIAREALMLLGYEVETARDGQEALALYQRGREAGRPFAAVIMDLTIPGGMGGKEAAGKLLEYDPQAKVLVSSGYSNDPVMANFADYGFVGVVPKPYQIEGLSRVLRDIL